MDPHRGGRGQRVVRFGTRKHGIQAAQQGVALLHVPRVLVQQLLPHDTEAIRHALLQDLERVAESAGLIRARIASGTPSP